MPIAKFQMPDGQIARFEVPEGMSPEDATQAVTQHVAGQMASEGMGPFESSMVAAGRTVVRLGAGAQQLYYQATGQQDKEAQLAQQQQEASAYYKPLEQAHPVATTLGSALPYMAVPGSGLAATVATGAAGGALDYQDPGQSRLMKGAAGGVGGALGYGAGRLLAKAITPITSAITRAQAKATGEAAQVAAGMGEKLKLTPGQRTGSAALRGIEASMESFPPTAGLIDAIKTNNQGILNKSFAKAIGESADTVDSTVLNKAYDRVGQVFDGAAKPVLATPGSVFNLGNDVTQTLARWDGLTRADLASQPLIRKAVDMATNPQAKPTLEALRSLASDLGQRARSEITSQSGDRELGFALRDIEQSLNKTVGDNLTGQEAKAFKEAMGQYRTLRIALDNPGVVNVDTGNVSGTVLSNVLGRKDKTGYKLGRNDSDLYKMTHFANANRDIVGNSGTATRQFLPWLLGAGALGAGVGGGGTALGSGELPAIGTGAGVGGGLAIAGLLGARGAGTAYLSPLMQAYLANGVLSPAMQGVLGKAGGAALMNPAITRAPTQ